MLLLTEQRGFVDGRSITFCSYGARKIHGVMLCYRHVAPNGAKRIRGRTLHYMSAPIGSKERFTVSCFATDMLLLRSKEDSWTDAPLRFAPTEQGKFTVSFFATDMLLQTEQREFVDGRSITFCSYGARKIQWCHSLLPTCCSYGAKRIRGRTLHYILLIRSKERWGDRYSLPHRGKTLYNDHVHLLAP